MNSLNCARKNLLDPKVCRVQALRTNKLYFPRAGTHSNPVRNWHLPSNMLGQEIEIGCIEFVEG